ncbi:bL21 family ribosomal protein, partial [Mycoplasmopsis synoviae]
FHKLLAVNHLFAKPYLTRPLLHPTIQKQRKANKILLYRHNPKSTHKTKLGHPQPYTLLNITKIKRK